MAEELICPDCAGIIGGEPGTGRAVCKCFESRPPIAVKTPPVVVAEPEPVAPASVEQSSPGAKPCRVCGKDLRGHRRLKDSRGYVCPACDADERRVAELADAQDLSLIPCPECNRRLKPEGITTVDGMVMCRSCAADHKELNKFKPAPLVIDGGKEAERTKLQWMLIILGVLALIMLLSYFGLIGSGRR